MQSGERAGSQASSSSSASAAPPGRPSESQVSRLVAAGALENRVPVGVSDCAGAPRLEVAPNELCASQSFSASPPRLLTSCYHETAGTASDGQARKGQRRGALWPNEPQPRRLRLRLKFGRRSSWTLGLALFSPSPHSATASMASLAAVGAKHVAKGCAPLPPVLSRRLEHDATGESGGWRTSTTAARGAPAYLSRRAHGAHERAPALCSSPRARLSLEEQPAARPHRISR